MTRGNQRDTDRAKNQKAQANKVRHPLPPKLTFLPIHYPSLTLIIINKNRKRKLISQDPSSSNNRKSTRRE
ncbi:MAG: hypothetical protein HC770_00615 [Pseudanabaena sp. CRU_2_10]|nr:hypothetical protein [Pseudanabaena sp. CRU_2_10]